MFFDDILIYSKRWEDHLSHVKIVLAILRTHNFYAKRSKCYFGMDKFEYLGHFISGQGVSTDLKKIEAVVNWPTPTSFKQLRGFLGLAGYYKRFVQGFGLIAQPLTTLCMSFSTLRWTEEADKAFREMKKAMIEACS